jgi:hypothetical protein
VKPARRISGTAMRVNTAAEAMEMPVIAAKIAFAPTVPTARPPGSPATARLATA